MTTLCPSSGFFQQPRPKRPAEQLGLALLRLGWPVGRVCLRRIDHRHQEAEFIAVWSLGDPLMRRGTTVPLGSTSFHETSRLGKPIMGPEDTPTLLDKLIQDEGMQSWVTIPLYGPERIEGLLSLSSRRPHTFHAEDTPFFERLGRAIQDHLVRLLSPIHG